MSERGKDMSVTREKVKAILHPHLPDLVRDLSTYRDDEILGAVCKIEGLLVADGLSFDDLADALEEYNTALTKEALRAKNNRRA